MLMLARVKKDMARLKGCLYLLARLFHSLQLAQKTNLELPDWKYLSIVIEKNNKLRISILMLIKKSYEHIFS